MCYSIQTQFFSSTKHPLNLAAAFPTIDTAIISVFQNEHMIQSSAPAQVAV